MYIDRYNTIIGIQKEMEYLDESREYNDLYSVFDNELLEYIFSKLHHNMVKLFKIMNSRLLNGSYRAQDSRDLILCIESTYKLYSELKNTDYSFEVDNYYDKLLRKCRDFLSDSNGSRIPKDMEKITIYYEKPIFLPFNRTVIKEQNNISYNRVIIGGGSYAKVYKYKDEFYDKYFAVKVANKNLTVDEKERFKREYDVTKQLNSPYIIEVYSYDEERMEYYMELADYTLEKYIKKNNNKLSFKERKNIINQIFRAFEYIHQKKFLHRDISIKNVLLKEYENNVLVKMSDFGLVKIPDSTLTKLETEIKGSFNDPNLSNIGFSNYNVQHEIYALTRLIYFICTGKKNVDKMDIKFSEFVKKGMDIDETKRYKNIEEMKIAFNTIKIKE